MAAPFDLDHAPPVGVAEALAPGLRVVTAGNGGPMTFTGTRTYLLGDTAVAVVDPGPDDPAHRAAILTALAGAPVAAVLVTHAHRDHSAGARALADAVRAPLLAHGDPAAARSPAMARLAAAGGLGGGEGIDAGFSPDEAIRDGAVVRGPGWSLRAIATPGHTADHLSLAWEEGGAVFTGDHVMGWATTLISPPDGDLGAFRASLARLRAEEAAVYYPGHGAPVRAPGVLVDHILAHRQAREDAIVAALAGGPAPIADLVAAIYADLAPALRPAAARNVLAHLLDLADRGLATADGPPATATWRLA